MPENAIDSRQEVDIGHRVYTSDGRPPFMGEKVHFKGERLGVYTADDSVDESRLKRTLIQYVLYRCPRGYRVKRSELHYQRRREGGQWRRREAFTSLLPAVDEDVAQNEATSGYALYTEEEARREFPELFSAVGMPNVRELD